MPALRGDDRHRRGRRVAPACASGKAWTLPPATRALPGEASSGAYVQAAREESTP